MRSEKRRINTANAITALRMAASLAILFVSALSPAFFVLYVFAALTDVADGFIARKTHIETPFGAKLDTAADIVFVAVCLIKLFPVLNIPTWLYICTAVIAAVKLANIIGGFVLCGCFVSVHSVLNKLTGILMFLIPLTLPIIPLEYSAIPTCIAAGFAAMHEGYVIFQHR